jgi:hypothetical protein
MGYTIESLAGQSEAPFGRYLNMGGRIILKHVLEK